MGSEHVSGMDFWENDPTYKRPNMGTIQFQDLTSANASGNQGTLGFVAHWVSKEGKLVRLSEANSRSIPSRRK